MLQMMKRRISNGFETSKVVSLGKLVSPKNYRKRSRENSKDHFINNHHHTAEIAAGNTLNFNNTSNLNNSSKSNRSSRFGMRLAKHKLQTEDIDDLLQASGIKPTSGKRSTSRSSINLQPEHDENQNSSGGSLMGEDMELPDEPQVTKPR